MNALYRFPASPLAVLFVLAFGFANPTARASGITFDFSELITDQTSYSLTNGMYGLTLLNPVNAGGVDNKFVADSDGIFLGTSQLSGTYNAGFSMQITGGALDFKNYEIGYINAGTVADFSLSGGTGSSTGNVLNPVGTYNFIGSYTISPGDTVMLSALMTPTPPIYSVSQIKSITFTPAAVPEPTTYAMALGGLACGAFSMWRRRKRA